jgi:UDP:flavonoid glycosyltransferase YjiC (YdhE family)
VVPPRRLTAKRLHAAVRAVLEDDSYRIAARKLQASIQQTDGLGLAADVVEEALKIKRDALVQAPN